MKSVLYLATALIVMGLAFWAYRENYRTQAALNDMDKVRGEIANLRDELGVLRAEWAYLNRPDRLRELVNLNFEKLQLVPLTSSQFIGVSKIPYPPPPTKRPPARPGDLNTDPEAVAGGLPAPDPQQDDQP